MPLTKKIKGLFVNFQDYSVHDGSGLRSLVFLKGCALKCKWCQNPECINAGKEIMFREKLCIDCGLCYKTCPAGAINKDGYRIDKEKCTNCGLCAEVCSAGALSLIGTEISVENLVAKIESYKVFYNVSNKGGVTISGGDPMFQPEFTIEVLKECRRRGIHTAIETALYAKEDVFLNVLQYVDLLLCDIKHMDDAKHKLGTGVSNQLILKNLKNWSQKKVKPECVVRLPLIPNYNDSKKNVVATCEFIKQLGIKQIDLLPFNFMASNKYKEMGMKWEYEGIKRQTDKKLEELSSAAKATGLNVTIGGLW